MRRNLHDTLSSSRTLVVVPIATGLLALIAEIDVLRPILLPILVAIATGLLLAVYRQASATHQEAVRLHRDVTHLWCLTPLVSNEYTPLPALGGAALSPAAAHQLITAYMTYRPTTLVELGPGASTILLVVACRRACLSTRFYGVEHDERYLTALRQVLHRLDASNVHLVHAPLSDGGWYDEKIVAAEVPDQVDFLVVDGPPNVQGRGARRRGFSSLQHRLAPGAIVLVDDTNRRDERAMVEGWLSTEADLRLVFDGGDFMLLRLLRH